MRGILAMLGRNFEVYRKTWKVNALPPLAEPALYLVAIGFGVGSLINEQVAGFDYIQFIAPGIIAITMMQTGFTETTYSSYIRLVFQKTWDACMATPLSVHDVLWGELAWAATRAMINAALMTVVVAAFGLLAWPTAMLIPIIAFIVGMLFAGIGLIVSSKVKVIDQFSYAFFLFITPQFLFSGTFFPLGNLPNWALWVARALPLTHAAQVTRAAGLELWSNDLWLSIGYLAVASTILPWVAVRAMRKRIIS